MATTLKNKLLNQIQMHHNGDADWVHYIRDHKRMLLSRASKITIPTETAITHRNRPADLLEYLGMDSSLTWIILFLNDLDELAEINNVKELYVIDEPTIKSLHASYLTWKNRVSKS
jgi:hypothetical protein